MSKDDVLVRHQGAELGLADGGGVTAVLPAVWVCIAVFNRIHYTRKCLELLLRQTYPNINPVVVDDGSSDGTSAMITGDHPEVTLLEGDGSLYWTGAMHRGMAHILAHSTLNDYVLLLNDDLVFDSDLVEKLIQKSKTHPQSLIQCVESYMDDPDLIWQGGVRLNYWTAKHRLINYRRRISEFPSGHFEKSDYLTARGVLVPAEVLRAIGNYDASYQQNGDPEFTRRAAKSGYDLIVSYDIRVLSYDKGKNLNEAESYSLSDIKKYYFGVLSAFRLSTRWKQATSMTNSGVQALVFFGFDLARITGHFVRRLKVRAPRASSVRAQGKLGGGSTSAYYLVWKAYQRRAETLAPRLGATLLCMPHVFRAKSLRPLDYLKNFLLTTYTLFAARPKFVFIQSPPLYAALAPWLLRIPYIIDAHNAVLQRFWGRLPLSGMLLRDATAVIVHNEEIREVAEQRLPGSLLITIRDPLNQIQWPVSRIPNRILFVCSFDAGEPVEMIADVVKSLPEYDFYVTADPLKLSRGIRAALTSLSNLTFTGFLSTEEYQKLLCSSALAVVLEEQESTQPSGACEAMASDTPLVVSRSALTSKLFGEWARVVNNRSDEIAAAIREAATVERLELSVYRERWEAEVKSSIGELLVKLSDPDGSRGTKAVGETVESPSP